jgi:hypothetical protein
MKKALLAVMAVALIIGFAGCSLFGGAKSPYYPLKEGNKWDYETTVITTMEYEDTTITPNTADTTTDTYSSEVIGETELTGEEALKVWEIKTGDETDYVHVDKDWVYFYDELSDSEEWYKWPNEPDVGDKWDVVFDIDDTTTYTISYEVTETGATAFGDYTDCLKIKVTPEDADRFDTYDSWMFVAKDVGTVMYKTNYTLIIVDYSTMTVESETKLTAFTEG